MGGWRVSCLRVPTTVIEDLGLVADTHMIAHNQL